MLKTVALLCAVVLGLAVLGLDPQATTNAPMSIIAALVGVALLAEGVRAGRH